MEDFKTKVLSSLPSWRDFIFPSRFPRLQGMVAGWLHLVVLVLAITGASSHLWLTQNIVEVISVGRAGTANITTIGHFGLVHYTVSRRIDAQNGTTWSGESGSTKYVVDIESLATLSSCTLAFLLIAIFLVPVSAGFTFYHSWARGPPRLMYIVACSLSGTITLCSLLGFLVYTGVMPKDDGYSMGWGFWLIFAVSFVEMTIFFLDLTMKPEGIPYYRRDKSNEESAGTQMSTVSSTSKPVSSSSTTTTASKSTSSTTTTAQKSTSSSTKTAQKQASSTTAPETKPEKSSKKQLRAKFDCSPDQEGDLGFKEGDIIDLISEEPGDGWVTGRLGDKEGILPLNYVEVI